MNRLRRSFGFALLMPAWPALAQWLGPYSLTIGLSQIDAVLARRFPLKRRLLDLLDIELGTPALRLLPQDNRLGANLHLQVTDTASAQRVGGLMGLNFGLRYGAKDASLRLVQPRLERIEFDAGPAGAGQLDPQWLHTAAPIVARLLDNQAVYRLKPEQLAAMRRAGVQPGEINVTPLGVEIRIEPMPEAPDPAR